MNDILTINGLSKFYGSKQVLKDLSLSVEKGTVFGLLGPNGSGKTTTLSIVLDIIPQNSGTYDWFEQGVNEPSHHARKRIGSILESPNFYDYLSAERNLKIAADIKGVPYSDIDRVLQFVSLGKEIKNKYRTFSLGMKQRLAIASALLGTPEVLILDEPTNGLDPQGISEIRELIMDISNQGITIVLASHMLDEVEKVCSDVAILKEGALLVQGTVNEILGEENILELKTDGTAEMEALLNALNDHPEVIKVKKVLDKFVVSFSGETSNKAINQYLFEKGIVLTHLVSKKKNLEKMFLEITNER